WAIFSPDGATLASAGEGGTIRVTDVASGAERLTLASSEGDTWRFALFAPDGRTLAHRRKEYQVELWDASSGEKRHTLHTRDSVESIAFSPDAQTLAMG